MSAADPEHIAFACLTELLFDISDTVDRIGSHPLEGHSRRYRACNHSRRKLWFGHKARVGRYVCGFQTTWILGPFLWKIQRAIDERMAMTRNVGSEDADLAVRNLAKSPGPTALFREPAAPCHSNSRMPVLALARDTFLLAGSTRDHHHAPILDAALGDDVIGEMLHLGAGAA